MDRSMEDRRPELGPGDVVVDEALARSLVPQRSFGAHKWGVGGLLVIAGAPQYVGAPLLCAAAAGRAGAGVINLAVPRGVIGAIAAVVPEVAYLILPEAEGPAGARRAAEEIWKRIDKVAAVVVGPGLGEDEAAGHLLGALWSDGEVQRRQSIGFGSAAGSPSTGEEPKGPLADGRLPAVIDADALNWLAGQERWWERLPRGRAVLTPHLGEMARLTKRESDVLAADPVAAARAAAREWGQTVIFKYGFTVATDGERAVVAADAPRSLATAGSGDVFAGVVGAFLAQGLQTLDAAALAIFVGCRAARRVEARFGTIGLLASDLPPAIAEELAELERGGPSR